MRSTNNPLEFVGRDTQPYRPDYDGAPTTALHNFLAGYSAVDSTLERSENYLDRQLIPFQEIDKDQVALYSILEESLTAYEARYTDATNLLYQTNPKSSNLFSVSLDNPEEAAALIASFKRAAGKRSHYKEAVKQFMKRLVLTHIHNQIGSLPIIDKETNANDISIHYAKLAVSTAKDIDSYVSKIKETLKSDFPDVKIKDTDYNQVKTYYTNMIKHAGQITADYAYKSDLLKREVHTQLNAIANGDKLINKAKKAVEDHDHQLTEARQTFMNELNSELSADETSIVMEAYDYQVEIQFDKASGKLPSAQKPEDYNTPLSNDKTPEELAATAVKAITPDIIEANKVYSHYDKIMDASIDQDEIFQALQSRYEDGLISIAEELESSQNPHPKRIEILRAEYQQCRREYQGMLESVLDKDQVETLSQLQLSQKGPTQLPVLKPEDFNLTDATHKSIQNFCQLTLQVNHLLAIRQELESSILSKPGLMNAMKKELDSNTIKLNTAMDELASVAYPLAQSGILHTHNKAKEFGLAAERLQHMLNTQKLFDKSRLSTLKAPLAWRALRYSYNNLKTLSGKQTTNIRHDVDAGEALKKDTSTVYMEQIAFRTWKTRELSCSIKYPDGEVHNEKVVLSAEEICAIYADFCFEHNLSGSTQPDFQVMKGKIKIQFPHIKKRLNENGAPTERTLRDLWLDKVKSHYKSKREEELKTTNPETPTHRVSITNPNPSTSITARPI